MRLMKAMIMTLIVITLILLDCPVSYMAASEAAKDLTDHCGYDCSSNENSIGNLTDGSHETAWTSESSDGQFLKISLPEGKSASGIYIMWNDVPEDWSLLESSGDSVWHMADTTGKENYINAYVPIDGNTTSIRIESDSYDWKMSVAELRVFGPGALPQDVQVWKAQPEKADLMVVAAHPDDELIYFGGTLPYYAGQLEKRTVVVYMTSSPIIRKFEALDGLWKVGVREYPVFLPLKNEYTSELADAEKSWDGLDNTVSLLVEQIRRFKPDVVVTHDLGGEYGHGAHMLTALAVEKAVDAGDKPGKYPESAERYGVWQVQKCYLHLLDKNEVNMDWETPLPSFGGKTALDMAKEGYALHVSQHFRERPILDTGEYDNSAFGLYFSSVGKDTEDDDFFENIKAPMATPEPTPVSLDLQTPSTRPENTQPATTQASAQSGNAGVSKGVGTVVAFVVAALSLLGLWAIWDRRTVMSAKHARRDKQER